MSNDIFRRLSCVVAETFNCKVEDINEQSVAHDISGWDSLSHVYLIMAVEREFEVKLPIAEVIRAANIGALVELVGRHERNA